MGLFDYVFNIVRSVSDLLHILVYLFIAIIAALFAYHRFDKDLYNKHVYKPLANFFSHKLPMILKNTISIITNYIFIIKLFLPTKLLIASNRLPYFINSLKIKYKNWATNVNKVASRLKNYFKKK